MVGGWGKRVYMRWDEGGHCVPIVQQSYAVLTDS